MAFSTFLRQLQPSHQIPSGLPISFLIVALAAVITLAGCGGGDVGPGIDVSNGSGGGSGGGSGTSGGGSGVPAGVTASLAWDPVQDPSVVGYIVHFGTQSPNSSGSCAYQQSTFSSSPSASIAGLSPNTTYYFAVSAYNGVESACSAEVTTVTKSV